MKTLLTRTSLGRFIAFTVLFAAGYFPGYNQTYTIGTSAGTNGSTGYPTPFGDYYEGSRQQYLFLASELTAAGMTAGSITAISWNVTALNGAGVHEQYTISMGTSALTVLSATAWETTGSTVYGPVNYQPVTGVNTFTFGTPFVWNGTSNIIVNVCHGAANTTAGNLYSANASVQYYQAPAGVFVTRGYRADNTNNFCSYTGTANTDFSTNAQRRLRPVTTFTMSTAACTGTPAPGNTIASANPVCSGSNFTLSLQNTTAGTGVTYQWQSGPSASGPWTTFGGGAATQVTSQTTATWYRCNVTCSGNTGSSAPVQVTMGSACMCNTYCAASQTTGTCGNSDEYISNVTFNTINNSSNCAGSLPGGYTNYTNIGTTITQNTAYILTVTNGNAYTGDQCHAYFDWNGDGTFGAGEDYTLTGGPVTFTASITPPLTSVIGSTRMRVRVFYTGTTASCGALGYGEAEDYCLTIDAPAACTGTPNAGTASISSTGNCLANNITLSSTGYTIGASGLMYQWQTSPNGTSGWTNIGGATNPASQFVSSSVGAYYRLVATCTPTSSSSSSNVVQFSTPYTVNAGADVNVSCAPAQLNGSVTGGIPTVLYSENFESVGANGVIAPTYGGWTEAYIGGGANTYWGIANTCPISGNYSMTVHNANNGNYCDYIAGNSIDVISYSPLINATGYTNLRLSFNWRCLGEPDDGLNGGIPYDWGQIAYSTDGTNWTLLPATYNNATTTQNAANISLSAMDGQSFYLGFRWANDFSVKQNPPFTVDDIVVSGLNASATPNYVWSGGTLLPNPNVQNPTVSASGTYALTVSAMGCVVSDTVVATISTSTGSYSTGDYVWAGGTSSDWLTLSNWLTHNGTALVTPSFLPGSANDVFIQAPGSCVIHQPQINTAGSTIAARDLTLLSGSTLTMLAGDLNIFRNFTGTGATFSPGTGRVVLDGTLPCTIAGIPAVYSLIVTKTSAAANITLTGNLNVQNLLTMGTNGNIYTGASILELGTSPAAPGSLTWSGATIIGNIKRWIGTATGTPYMFPVGSDLSGTIYNRYCTFNYSSAPNGGSITVHFINGPAPYNTGLPLNDAGQPITNFANEGYWEAVPGDGLSTGTYTLTLRGNNFTTVTDLQSLRLIKSPMPHTTWTLNGSHAGPNTGTLTDPVVSRSGMNGFSFFTIGGDNANPLPIELVLFDAKCINHDVNLRWATASEINNQYFSIQRSTDGINWAEIGRVNGAGNSNDLRNYNFSDIHAPEGLVYYRLQQFDYNGENETFTPSSVNCGGADVTTVRVYPNPTTDNAYIELQLAEDGGNGSIVLTDLTGRKIRTKQVTIHSGENKFQLENLQNYGSGIYLVQIELNGEIISTIRLVKQ